MPIAKVAAMPSAAAFMTLFAAVTAEERKFRGIAFELQHGSQQPKSARSTGCASEALRLCLSNHESTPDG
jgi:hypothetical protein